MAALNFEGQLFAGKQTTEFQLLQQGGADFAYNIFYAGIWASGIDFSKYSTPV